MPKVAWSTFVSSRSGVHLVAGVIPPEIQWWAPKQLLSLIGSLVTRLVPAGRYALTIDRESGTPEIQCAFEQAADADKLAAVVHAEPVVDASGWTSHRTFVLDDAVGAAIKASLASNGKIDQR
jgi:hypothetical protein